MREVKNQTERKQAFRLLRPILIFPFNVLGVIPGLILWFSGEFETLKFKAFSLVSGGLLIGVGFFIVCYYYITKNNKFFYLSIAAGMLIGIVRIGAGAHFLSDILMSFVVVNIILQSIRYLFVKWEKTKT